MSKKVLKIGGIVVGVILFFISLFNVIDSYSEEFCLSDGGFAVASRDGSLFWGVLTILISVILFIVLHFDALRSGKNKEFFLVYLGKWLLGVLIFISAFIISFKSLGYAFILVIPVFSFPFLVLAAAIFGDIMVRSEHRNIYCLAIFFLIQPPVLMLLEYLKIMATCCH